MNGYRFGVCCGFCGGDLEHVNATAGASQAVAVAACVECGREWLVTVLLRLAAKPDSRRRSAYRELARDAS